MTQTMIPSYGRNMNAGELDTNKCVIVQRWFQNVCIYICYKTGAGCWIHAVGTKSIRILIYTNDWDKP